MDIPSNEWMRRALRMAAGGRGRVEPNPMVGCVIERDGRVLGEGFHEIYGGPHAEANALARAGDAAGATVHVTLEPCCHTEKQTPPCVPKLIAAKVARVVVAMRDPNPAVAGKGIAQLTAAGIAVIEDVLGDSARQMNAAYFARMKLGRPYVTLKWAQTADGKVGRRGGALRISNETSRAATHRLRAACDAILIGIGTLLADDPLLTPRNVPVRKPPLRIVLDSNLRIPHGCRLLKTPDMGPVMVCCAESAAQRASSIARAGVEIFPLPPEPQGGVSMEPLLAELGRRGMTHLLVEPGPTLAGSLLRKNLADRVWVFHSSQTFPDPQAPMAVSIDLPVAGEAILDGDRLLEHLNPKSAVYFVADPSADILQISSGQPAIPLL